MLPATNSMCFYSESAVSLKQLCSRQKRHSGYAYINRIATLQLGIALHVDGMSRMTWVLFAGGAAFPHTSVSGKGSEAHTEVNAAAASWYFSFKQAEQEQQTELTLSARDHQQTCCCVACHVSTSSCSEQTR